MRSGSLHAYLAGILSHHDCVCIEINSVADHVHCLLRLSRTQTLAKVVEQMKTGSNHWLKGRGHRDFAWQSGYGAFSVSETHAVRVREYIRSQGEHHRMGSFQDELRELCRKNGVQMDERYVWD